MLLAACAPAGIGGRNASVTRPLEIQADAAAAAVEAPAPAPVAPAAPPAEVAIAPPPDTMEGPAASAPPPALLRSRPTGKGNGTWAVIVGINDYPGTAYDLRSAVNDADDIDRALGTLGVPPERRLVLRDGQAGRKTLQSSVDWLVANAGPDAVAVFFFAGHVRKLAGGNEAMVTADGAAFSDTDLAARLSGLSARRAWIGIAACYGGGFTEVLRPGRVLTGAAPANERAYENSAFGRSYMVEYMVRQGFLEGRASASVQAAFGYARDAIARDYPNRVPVQFDHSTGPLDLRQPGWMPAPTSGASGQPSASASTPPPQEPPPSGSSSSGNDGGDPKSPPPKKCDPVSSLLGC